MKSNYLQPLLSAAVLCATASAAFGQFSFSDNFNGLTPGNNLQSTTPQNNWFATANSFVVESGTGLSGSNSIATASTADRTAIWDVGSFDFTKGAITASLYFSVTTSGGSVQLSLFSGNTATTSRSSIVLNTTTSGTSWTNVLNGSSGTNTTLGANISTGAWYYLNATFTPSGSNLDIKASLYSSDGFGVVSSTRIGNEYSVSLTAPAVVGDTTLYGGFRSSFAGKTDNIAFSQIPEPASFAALAGLGALGLVGARRRRSAV